MEILITAERIQQRVDELARMIDADYCRQPITIVGVLTGSMIFLADLVRRLDLPLRIDQRRLGHSFTSLVERYVAHVGL